MTRGPVGDKRVSEEAIKQFIEYRALEKRFQEAICRVVGRDPSYFGKEFASTILKEALINTYEHPFASMSMIAMAKDISNGSLIVAVADNGEHIPRTIEPDFLQSSDITALEDSIVVSDRDRETLLQSEGPEAFEDAINRYKRDVAATVYATQEGTSSKKQDPRCNRGLGLYWVKTRSLEFGGTCAIRAGSALTIFSKNGEQEVVKYRAVANWPGNLISIALPLANR